MLMRLAFSKLHHTISEFGIFAISARLFSESYSSSNNYKDALEALETFRSVDF